MYNQPGQSHLSPSGLFRYMHVMHNVLTRYLLTLLLVLGLIAPKLSAAVAMALPGAQIAVICTGDAMVTLVIGADGKPIQTELEDAGPCAFGNQILTADPVVPQWQHIARQYAHVFAIKLHPAPAGKPYQRRRPAHGPPVMI